MVPAVQRVVRRRCATAGSPCSASSSGALIDPPGPNAALELRHGALISLGGALVLGICSQTVASAPSRKRVVHAEVRPAAAAAGLRGLDRAAHL